MAWYDGRPADVGGTTAGGLSSYRVSGDPRAGSVGSRSVANGSLMRSAPFALIEGDAAELAADSSRTTHAHPEVLACVRLYVRMLQLLREGQPVDPDQLADLAERQLHLHPGAELADIPCGGAGHAVYAVDLAVWAATMARDFTGGIAEIVRTGGDTDTNGAICGAILAARFGFPDSLSNDLDSVRVMELETLADRLCHVGLEDLHP